MAKTQYIETVQIKTEGLQTRAQISMDAVREYATDERERGAVFPPLTVFHDGAVYWLADGFHRLGAARQNGKKKVACEVREGGFADALRHALGANSSHGMRRTHIDIANAVKLAYEKRTVLGFDAGEPAARAIADLIGCDPKTVTVHLGKFPTWKNATERVGSDGKTYPVLPPPPVRRSVPPDRAANGTDGTKGTDETDGGATTLNAERSTPNAQVLRVSSPPVRRPTPPPVRRNPTNGPVDGRGREIPPDLLEIWNRRGEARDLAGMVSRVRVALRDAQDGKDPLWSEINFGSALAHLDMAYKEIAAAEPWCVCPMCQGIGCEACRGRGLMGKFRYDNVVPENIRKAGCQAVS
jgi:uncharacterized ParB-like nuclease family protein